MMDQSPLLSPVARAILAGMRQNPNYAQQAQQAGLADLDEALRLKAVADKVSQSPNAQGPAPGNVVDDLKMKVQMALSGQSAAPPMPQGMPPQGAPQGAMPPQGMPPQGAMPPQQPPMDPRMAAGIGTLPAPNMTQGMAAGGIVAFARGGDEGLGNKYGRPYGSPPDVVGPYLDEYGPLFSQEEAGAEVARESAGEAGEAAPPSGYGVLGAYLRETNAPEVDRGAIQSDVNKAYSPLERMLAGRAAELQQREQEAKNLSEADLKELQKQNKYDLAAAFFKAAASGNTTALGALGEGFGGAAQAKSAAVKEERALKRELAKEKERLADANYAVKETGARLSIDQDAETQRRYDNAREMRETSLYRRAGLQLQLEDVQARKAMYSARGAGAIKSAAAVYAPQISMKEAELAQAQDPQERAQIAQEMKDIRARWTEAASAEAALEPKQQQSIDTKVQDALAAEIKDKTSSLSRARLRITQLQSKPTLTREEQAKLQEERQKYATEAARIEQETRSIYEGVYGGMGGVGNTNTLSELINTPPWQ